jgi:hypothetical protein
MVSFEAVTFARVIIRVNFMQVSIASDFLFSSSRNNVIINYGNGRYLKCSISAVYRNGWWSEKSMFLAVAKKKLVLYSFNVIQWLQSPALPCYSFERPSNLPRPVSKDINSVMNFTPCISAIKVTTKLHGGEPVVSWWAFLYDFSIHIRMLT